MHSIFWGWMRISAPCRTEKRPLYAPTSRRNRPPYAPLDALAYPRNGPWYTPDMPPGIPPICPPYAPRIPPGYRPMHGRLYQGGYEAMFKNVVFNCWEELLTTSARKLEGVSQSLAEVNARSSRKDLQQVIAVGCGFLGRI